MAATTTKTATPKAKTAAAGAGVKKAGRPPGKGGKNGKAKTAMVKMQAYFKENRSKYEGQSFKEQQKALGADWKASSENPKNQ